MSMSLTSQQADKTILTTGTTSGPVGDLLTSELPAHGTDLQRDRAKQPGLNQKGAQVSLSQLGPRSLGVRPRQGKHVCL